MRVIFFLVLSRKGFEKSLEVQGPKCMPRCFSWRHSDEPSPSLWRKLQTLLASPKTSRVNRETHCNNLPLASPVPKKTKVKTYALFSPHPQRISLSNLSIIVTLDNLLRPESWRTIKMVSYRPVLNSKSSMCSERGKDPVITNTFSQTLGTSLYRCSTVSRKDSVHSVWVRQIVGCLVWL